MSKKYGNAQFSEQFGELDKENIFDKLIGMLHSICYIKKQTMKITLLLPPRIQKTD